MALLKILSKNTSLLPPVSMIPPLHILFTPLFYFLPILALFHFFLFHSFIFYYILLHFVSFCFISLHFVFISLHFVFILLHFVSFRFISYFSRTREILSGTELGCSARPVFLCILHARNVVRISLANLVRKNNTLHHYPTPYPASLECVPACYNLTAVCR